MSDEYRKISTITTITTNALPQVAEAANEFRNVEFAATVPIKALKDRAKLRRATGGPGEAVHFTVNVRK
jgi:hypothetical protein